MQPSGDRVMAQRTSAEPGSASEPGERLRLAGDVLALGHDPEDEVAATAIAADILAGRHLRPDEPAPDQGSPAAIPGPVASET
jgi:hypothetical protein